MPKVTESVVDAKGELQIPALSGKQAFGSDIYPGVWQGVPESRVVSEAGSWSWEAGGVKLS